MGAYNSTTGTAGALQGNQILRDSQTLVRNLLYSTTTGGTSAYQTLSDIGVTVGTDGSLTLNSSKLEGALAADSVAVATLVTKIGESYNSSLESTVGYTGKIKTATDSANTIIKDLEARQSTGTPARND